MKRQVTPPTSKAHWLEMRKKNLNSTEVSALFGCNPYLSEFELWHQKKDQSLPPFEENERMVWGTLLEPAIAERAALKMNWMHRPMKDYYEIPELRLGSSFDFRIVEKNLEKSTPQRVWLDTKATMEIKNVDYMIFHKNWIVEEADADEDYNDSAYCEIEAPPHIEIQVQVQMIVSGLPKCYLCVLVGGNDLKIIEKNANPEMQKLILDRCAEFWKSIDNNQPPDIDYQRDASFLIDLYGTADDDSVIALSEHPQADVIKDLVEGYINARENITGHKEKMKTYKAQILELIGEIAKVKGDEWSISAGNIDPTEIKAHVKKGYRNFKITKKSKKASADDGE